MSFLTSLWKLTLCSGKPGEPTEIVGDKVKSYKDADFYEEEGYIVFKGRTDGVTTSGSSYCRTELRELAADGKLASWSPKKGTHQMDYTFACVHLPAHKPEVVIGQIHDSKDDVIEIRLSGSSLEVIHNTTHYGQLLSAYNLKDFVTVSIVAKGGKIYVKAGQKTIAISPKAKDGCYFKLGSYVQSNASKGDPHDYAEVHLKAVTVTHTA